MVGIIVTELSFITERQFDIVVDFRRQAGAEFNTEAVQSFAVDAICRAVGQSNDRTARIIKHIISEGNPDFRTQGHLVFKRKFPVRLGADHAGQDVGIVGGNPLVNRIRISVLTGMDITQSCFRSTG